MYLLKLISGKSVGKIFKDSSWLFSANIVSIIAGIIQVSLVSRILGPHGIGILGVFIAIIGVVQGVFSIKSAETILTFAVKHSINGDERKVKQIIIFCFSMDFLSAVLSYFVVIIISFFFLEAVGVSHFYRSSFLLYSLIIIFTFPIVSGNSLLRFRNKLRINLLVTTLSSISKIALSSMLYIYNAEIGSVIWIYLMGSMIEGISIFYYSIHGLNLGHVALGEAIYTILKDKEILRFQYHGYWRELIKNFSRYLDLLFIGHLSGQTSQVGMYRISKQVMGYMQLPINSVAAAIYPEFSRLWYGGLHKELTKIIKILLIVFTIVAIILFLLISIFGKNIVVILFGPKFVGTEWVLNIIIIAGMLNIIMTPIYSLPAITGDAKPAMYANLFGFIFQLIFTIILVPKYYAIGAAWANVVNVTIWTLIIVPFVWRIIKNANENSIRFS